MTFSPKPAQIWRTASLWRSYPNGLFRVGLTGVCAPRPGWAHASDQMFVLLLPTDMLITAGCCVVVASIVLASLLPAGLIRWLFTPVGLASCPTLSFLARPLRMGARVGGLGALAILVVIGFLGPNDPLSNALPLSVWSLWWAGGLVVACFIATGAGLPGYGHGNMRSGGEHASDESPPHHDVWPGLCLFATFGLFALADPAPEDPKRLAIVVGTYLLFTILGAYTLGLRTWLARWEFCAILLRLIGALAPLQGKRSLTLGLPGWRMVAEHSPPHLSTALWCILFLGIGSFDGLKETFWWLGKIGVNPLDFPGRSAVVVSSLIGAVLFNLALMALIWLSVVAGACLARSDIPRITLFSWFSLSLLPIAVGYHFGHFLISFLINIQYLPPILSDPLGTGADYLGLGHYYISLGFLYTRDTIFALWLAQAGVVVFSHIIAVLLVHHIACKLLTTRREILLIQLPLSGFMVAYTLFGLWLLATPRGA